MFAKSTIIVCNKVQLVAIRTIHGPPNLISIFNCCFLQIRFISQIITYI